MCTACIRPHYVKMLNKAIDDQQSSRKTQPLPSTLYLVSEAAVLFKSTENEH